MGSSARAAISELHPTPVGVFPLATLMINLVGCLVLGLFVARRQRTMGAPWSLQFWAIGVLGSFTTFSTFSAEVFLLVESDALAAAAGYVLLSVFGGLAAAIVGLRLGAMARW